MEVSWGNQIIPLRKTAFEHYIKDMHQETKGLTARNLDATDEERLTTKCRYNWGKQDWISSLKWEGIFNE